ncbi:MAG: hypothetical protein M1830_004687, partial [Pleopsidium flavum]
YGDEEPYDRDQHDRESREKSKRDGDMLAAGLGGGVSGGLVAEEGRDRERRRDEGREKDSRESRESSIVNEESHDRDRYKKVAVDKGGQDGDTSGEERRERRRRRRREREALEREREERDPRDEILRERSRDRDPEEEEQRRRTHHHQHDDSRERWSHGEKSDGDEPTNIKGERSRIVGVVSPTREKEPEQPVKSILRPPREKFPEDPAPVREGVAPLKDAGKKGIPPNARWTKIDRKLVNPEALEDGNERYEERTDFVIVLRVLTKEEIQNYAARTQEIRDARYLLERQGDPKLRLGEPEHDREPEAIAKPIEDRTRNVSQTLEPGQDRPKITTSEASKRDVGQEPVNGRLREDPNNPGTYTGYRRNPPAPRQGKQ